VRYALTFYTRPRYCYLDDGSWNDLFPKDVPVVKLTSEIGEGGGFATLGYATTGNLIALNPGEKGSENDLLVLTVAHELVSAPSIRPVPINKTNTDLS
jgi:hypothetical protein